MGPRLGHSRRRRPISLVVGILAAAVLAAGFLALEPSGVTGAVGDVGREGPSFSRAGPEPPGSKPESKLWWHDGLWWGSLWHAASRDHHIFRLDPASQTWTDTGVPIDTRSNTRSDVLWDGHKLYVASHVFGTSSSPGYPARLFRFSYDPAAKTYSLDPGFPAAINDYRTETLVIDKDSTGRLWSTWVQGASVYVSHTLADDRSWAMPFVLPASGATRVGSDDISSLVAFGGSKVGVLWSNQRTGSFSFAVHLDGQPPWSWRPVEIALGGPLNADDHINLKADRDGRVFAAVRTVQTDSTAPQVLLLARTPTGTWSRHVVGTVADKHGRPILLLDEGNRRAHVFATSAENNGTVYAKSAPLDAPVFPAGFGTPFLRSVASATMNNPTSTKQSVSGATEAVVVGGLGSTSRYWHNTLELRGRKKPSLEADLVGRPTSGFAPLTVAFSDRSSAGVTGRTWNFGDGSPISTDAAPVHTYEAPGSYTVTLTVWGEKDSESARTRHAYVTVLPLVAEFSGTPTSGRVPLYVGFTDASSGTIASHLWDFGDGTTSTETNPVHAYRSGGLYTVRLTVTDAAGNSATSTRTAYVNALPLTAEFTAAPQLGAAPLTVSFSDSTLGTPTEWSWDFGDGTTSSARNPAHAYEHPGRFTVSLTTKDAAGNTSTRTRSDYVTTLPLTADFIGAPTVGPAPLTVAFTDSSSGSPIGWSWDFGDGSAMSHEANPSHTYRLPGAYTVTLTVRDANGEDSTKTKTSYVTATSDFVLRPAADAFVRSSTSSANTNFGKETTIRVRNGSSEHQRSYLAFDVPTLPGTLVSAKLRLFVTNSSTQGGDIHAVPNTWSEWGITWANAPGVVGAPLAAIGEAPTNTWVERALPLSTFTPGPGLYAFSLSQAEAASDVSFASREAVGPKRPQLVLTVDYGPENEPPDALDDGASTDEDARVVVDVLANDDPGLPEETDQSLELEEIATPPANGRASIVAGKISYVPRANYNGPDALVYRTCDDGADRLCSTARLDVSVLPVNDPPRAIEDAVAGTEDVTRVLALRANDIPGPPNEEAQIVTVEALTAPPQHGHAEIVGGRMVYTPAPDYNGSDMFAYRACDDGVPRLCDEATVSVSLASVNDAPRAAADTAVTDEDLATLAAVLANDNSGPADESGQELRIEGIAAGPDDGAATVEDDGVRYAPALDFHGRDTFSYRVCDTGDPSLCATGVVAVDVLSVNDLPAARDDRAVADEDSFVSIEVLANDGPGESEQTLELVHLLSSPAHGTAEIVAGRVVYTPVPDYNGVDELAYRACDNGSPRVCVEAEVVVTVLPVNDPPRADADTALAAEDIPAIVAVLANDDTGPADEEEQALMIDGIVAPPGHGAVMVGQGWVRYTPAADYSGSDTFTYNLCDGGDPSLCTIGVVDVEVVAANDGPGARDDSATGLEDSSVTVDVLANDDSGPDETAQWVRLTGIASAPAHGTAVVDDGRVVYTPAADYHGFDSLAYRVCDDGSPEKCSAAMLAIQVRPVNDPPQLGDDAAVGGVGPPQLIDVLANDSPGPGERDQKLVLQGVTVGPAHGAATVEPFWHVRYAGWSRHSAADAFVYQVCDDGVPALCSIARVSTR